MHLKNHAEKLCTVLRQSARISRSRVPIWHSCTMLFVKILAFDQNGGKRQQVHHSADKTTPAIQVANDNVTRIGSEPCDDDLLPPNGPESKVSISV